MCNGGRYLVTDPQTEQLSELEHIRILSNVKLHHCPLLLCKLHCSWANNSTGETAPLSVAEGSLTIWPSTGNPLTKCLPVWRTTVVKQRPGQSHLAWLIMNQGQMNTHQGQSRKHPTMIMVAVHTIYESQPEEQSPCISGLRTQKPIRNDYKKSCMDHSSVTMILHWSFSPALVYKRSEHRSCYSWYRLCALLTDTSARWRLSM